MAKICAICGKKPLSGHKICRRGLAKRHGGIGVNITGITKRRFMPNLQKVKALIKGSVKSIRVCTRCLKANKVLKAA